MKCQYAQATAAPMRTAGMTQKLNSSTRPEPLCLTAASTPPVMPKANAVPRRATRRKSRWVRDIPFINDDTLSFSGRNATNPDATLRQDQCTAGCAYRAHRACRWHRLESFRYCRKPEGERVRCIFRDWLAAGAECRLR